MALCGSVRRRCAFLEDQLDLPLADEAAERPVWFRYYAIVLEVLGVIGEVTGLAEANTARWETSVWVEAYPWTMPVLREL